MQVGHVVLSNKPPAKEHYLAAGFAAALPGGVS